MEKYPLRAPHQLLRQISITGNYTLYNMKSEADITSGFSNGSILPAGFYKVMATAPTDNSTNNVTVTYTNRYADITYNYYNQLGQLIGSASFLAYFADLVIAGNNSLSFLV